MYVTEATAKQVFSQILTSEMHEIICEGIKYGFACFEKRNASEREELGEYATNSASRSLFSYLCMGLQKRINESDCPLWAKAETKTCSKYVEIKSKNMIMHLRNEKTELAKYAKEKCVGNANFSVDNTNNYVQLVFASDDNVTIGSLSYLVLDEQGKELYREPIEIVSAEKQLA